MTTDALGVKLVWDLLCSAVNTASKAEKHSAFSTAVTEANDFACAVLTTTGRLIATSDSALPSFAIMISSSVKELVERGELDSPQPGDIYICNDPWLTTQNNDILVIKPIFRDERFEGFGVSMAHNPDLGGLQQLSKAKDYFEEGLQIPLVSLFDRGERNTTTWKMIAANSRTPEQSIGDIEAQVVAVESIAERTVEMLSNEGESTLNEWADEIFRRTSSVVRGRIAELPDGVYTAEKSFPDSDLGLTAGVMVDLRVSVTIRGDEMVVDYRDTSDAVVGSVNSLRPFTVAYTLYAIHLLFASGISHNDGIGEPVDILTRPGSALAAAPPSPTWYRFLIGHRACDLITRALAELVPDRARAESGSAPAWVMMFIPVEGERKNVPRMFSLAGGSGAGVELAGSTVHYPANIGNTPVEVLEKALPIRVLSKELVRGSGGVGLQPGGEGQRVEFEALAPMLCSFMGGNFDAAPRGIFGGGDGAKGFASVAGEEIRPGTFRIAPGQRVVFQSPGGGGSGSAA